MSNAKIVSDCPKCHTKGETIGHHKGIITLGCNTCKYTWKTISKICDKCKEPNHSTEEKICRKCYLEQRYG